MVEKSGLVSQWLLIPSHCLREEGIFLELHGKNLAAFLEGKAHKNTGSSLRLWPPGFSYSHISFIISSNLSKLPVKYFYQFMGPRELLLHVSGSWLLYLSPDFELAVCLVISVL